MKHITDRRGFITIEASIVLPVILVVLLALGYYIKIFAVMENVSYSMMEEVSKAAAAAYVTKNYPLLGYNVAERVQEDSHEVQGLKITKSRYLYNDGDMENMIAVDAEYKILISLPLDIEHTSEITSRVKCRGFTGTRNTGHIMSFDEMETDGVWDPVWVFPSDGEKFHSKICTYVTVNARQLVLTHDVKKKFRPCELCDAGDVSTGAFVYCFMENGTVYHTENCRQVKRYTIEINRREALDKGFTPCTKCGGG